jgi:transposase
MPTPSTPPGPAGALPAPAPEVLAKLIRAQVRLLRTLLATITDLDRALGAALLGHAKAKLLAPMPRIGELNLAQLLAEVGPILDRVDNAEQAIAECGAAPVTRASGKTRTVGFRWAANRRARTALHAFADNSRHASPWAAKLYADARRRGKHHPQAIRILARAWLRVMWACWHTDTAYDPAKHRAEQRLAA